jgi:hypothetical protein
MKTPSRNMPKYVPPNTWPPFVGWLLLVAFVGGLLWWIWEQPIVLLFIVVIGVMIVIEQRSRRIKLSKLSQERKELSICEFARSFDCRSIDTWAIRAVYETIQDYVSTPEALIPIKAEDDLTGVLEIDDEDLDMDLLVEMLQRTGRSMDDTPSNPYYGKVKTVADLVYFVNAQPLISNT